MSHLGRCCASKMNARREVWLPGGLRVHICTCPVPAAGAFGRPAGILGWQRTANKRERERNEERYSHIIGRRALLVGVCQTTDWASTWRQCCTMLMLCYHLQRMEAAQVLPPPAPPQSGNKYIPEELLIVTVGVSACSDELTKTGVWCWT